MEAGSKDSLADQLLELHNIQATRVAQEEVEQIKAAEAERRRAEAAALRRREEEEARLQAAEEARISEERAQRAEEERRARATKEAELRVQLEEEAKARAAEQQRLLEHEKELAAITAVERAKLRSRRILLGGLLMVVLGAVGAYVFVVQPAIERQEMVEEIAKQEHLRSFKETTAANAQAAAERDRTAVAERGKQTLEERFQKKEDAKQAAAAAASSKKPKATSKKKKPGCAPDDPLCGLPL